AVVDGAAVAGAVGPERADDLGAHQLEAAEAGVRGRVEVVEVGADQHRLTLSPWSPLPARERRRDSKWIRFPGDTAGPGGLRPAPARGFTPGPLIATPAATWGWGGAGWPARRGSAGGRAR